MRQVTSYINYNHESNLNSVNIIDLSRFKCLQFLNAYYIIIHVHILYAYYNTCIHIMYINTILMTVHIMVLLHRKV